MTTSETIFNECVEEAKRIYKENWENGNPLSPKEFEKLIMFEFVVRFKEIVENNTNNSTEVNHERTSRKN